MKSLQILIIDDDRIYALGLRAWLRGLGMANCTRAADAVPYGDDHEAPDLVLLDPQMAGKMCTAMIRDVKRRFPQCRIVVCSAASWFENGELSNAMAAGADAFYCKGQPDQELLLTIFNLAEPITPTDSEFHRARKPVAVAS